MIFCNNTRACLSPTFECYRLRCPRVMRPGNAADERCARIAQARYERWRREKMPTPDPQNETRQEFMDRCVPQVIADGTAADGAQASAICSSMWDDAKKAICPECHGTGKV